jgi:ABC-2 type transport system ATP-binding protein
MTGAYRPTAGDVRLFGVDPTRLSRSARRRVGYLPQLPALYPHLTLWQNLRFYASMNGVGWRRRRRLRDVLDLVELSDARRTTVARASGGMQRRLALAATLVHDPWVLFLDEPTAGIDPILRARFWEHFRALRDGGKTVVVTTQYVGEAAWCDEICVMSDGRIVTTGTPDELRRAAFGGDVLELRVGSPLGPGHVQAVERLPLVRPGSVEQRRADDLRLAVDDAGSAIPALIEWCRQQGIDVESCEQRTPDFDEVFVRIVGEERLRRGGTLVDAG